MFSTRGQKKHDNTARALSSSRAHGLTKTLGIAVAVLSILGMSVTAKAASQRQDAASHSSFWPLGDKVEVESLKDYYVPFKSVNPGKKNGSIPARPKLLVEKGDAFLGVGNLSAGFEVPVIGAVWQPRLWAFLIYRTALQTYNNGTPTSERETEWAHRLDLFVNLQLTGTEKILLGIRALDDNRPNRFTRYTFDGRNEGFNKFFRANIETFFFEGDLGSLIPNLDNAGIKPIDIGFTIGRQPIAFQKGMLINDTVDAIGIVRNNLVFPYTSNLRISGMWAFNRLDRNDAARNANENMFGLFTAIDAHVSTFNLDLIYVNDSKGADGFYVGASAIQRIRSLDNLTTALRVNSSFALENEVGGNVIGNGTLISLELSKVPHGSDDLMYFNPFIGIGNFTQAGREAIVGGPLANLGILFASPSLSTYVSELNGFTKNVVGAALGYQAFFDHKRRNVILEVAGRHTYKKARGTGIDQLGFGVQVQQAIGRRIQLQFEAFYALNSGQQDGAGARAEFQVVY